MQETLLIVLLALAIVWLIVRIRGNKPDAAKQTGEESQKNSAYHAVSIKYSENACTAAKTMTGRRFLATAAPRLPLPECDVLDCRCKFAHHADRRVGNDRRSPFSSAGFRGGTGTFEKERRERRDRRKDDDLDGEWN